MNENNKETFLTTLTDEKQVRSFEFNDDDMDIEIKSSTDSEDVLRPNTKAEEILQKKEFEDLSSFLIPHVESIHGIENRM
jgi:hypothetical protein